VQHTTPYKVLLAGIGTNTLAIRSYLSRNASVNLIEIASPEISSNDVPEAASHHLDVAVLGSGLTQPLTAAGQIKRRTPRAQVVFLVSKERMERFRASLPFVPQLADAWTAVAEDSGDMVAAVILEAARAARRREAVTSVWSRINAQISTRAALEEAHRRERQILLSERFMATVLKQAPDPIFALDTDGEIISSNDAASRLFVNHRNGQVGEPVWLLFPQSIRPQIEGLLARARAGEVIERYEILISTTETNLRNAAISLASIRDSDDLVVGYAITVRDITELRIAENRLRAVHCGY
jgi:PAS domain S-box-containing protein